VDQCKRITAIWQIEEAVSQIVDATGWIPEAVEYIDEEGEPFRAKIQLRHDPVEESDVL